MELKPTVQADGWSIGNPSEAGLDTKALSELVEKIDTGWVPNIHAVLIEHRGLLVFEHYWPGEDISVTGPLGHVAHGPTTLHDIRSLSKSVTSLLLGIAPGESFADVLNRPVTHFFLRGRDLTMDWKR